MQEIQLRNPAARFEAGVTPCYLIFEYTGSQQERAVNQPGTVSIAK
jgi:hypothetical protein